MAKRYVRKKNRRDVRPGLWALLIALLALIVVLIVVLSRNGGDEPAAQGDGLWDGGWYEDDLGRIQGDRALVKGMKAFEQDTGVRPYLTILEGVDPEELDLFAGDQYEALFGSGDHLLVIYDEWGTDAYYLAARTGAESALTDRDVSLLLSCIEQAYADADNASYADAFGAGFARGAEELAVRSGRSKQVNLLLGLGILLAVLSAVLFLFLRKKARLDDAWGGDEG